MIVTVHGSDINYFAMKSVLRPDIVDALNRARKVICVSNSLSMTLKEIGVTSETVIIPNGIDVNLYVSGDKKDACKLLGLDHKRPRILFAGNFYAVKGLEYLICAMPLILKTHPGCELVLIGANPESRDFTRYDKFIKGAGVEHAVTIVESVPHGKIPPWFRAADLCVLPSISEGFGLVAAEALACGRPVVATRSGGPEDIVKEGMGYLVPTKDPDALGEAIVRVLNGERIMSPESIAESARSRFSYESVVKKILNVYRDVLNN